MYDPACEDLALHFLGTGASERLVKTLAQHIQNSIELFCEEAKAELELRESQKPQ